jgi:hypothetical protein
VLEGDRSLAAAFVSRAERRDLEARHGEWLRQLQQDNPELSLWDLCRLASGDYSIVRRPRCALDVRAPRMNEPVHLREGE